MTSAARDALIGLSLLWVLFGVVVGLRLLGRKKGVGIGVDDILAVVAFVGCIPSWHRPESGGKC